MSELSGTIRRVLHSQDEELPQAEQDAARAELNHRYDAFVATFGNINTERRSVVRRSGAEAVTMVRRPNLQVLENLPRRIEALLESGRQNVQYLQQQLEGGVRPAEQPQLAEHHAGVGCEVFVDPRGPFRAQHRHRVEPYVTAREKMESIEWRDPVGRC